MTHRKHVKAILASASLALALLLSGIGHTSENHVEYISVPDAGSVVVKGDSTVHAWRVDSQHLEGKVIFSQDGPENALARDKKLTFELTKAHVRVPVKSIAGEKEGLNEKMYNALEADAHKHITYELTNARLLSQKSPNKVRIQTEGKLTISGTTRRQQLTMTVRRSTNGRLTASGNVDLKMTDFGIDPPTAMWGAISAHDKVTVSWKWITVPQYRPRYRSGSKLDEQMKTLLEQYDRVRSSLARGKQPAIQEMLKQKQQFIEKIDGMELNIKKEAQNTVKALLEQLHQSVKKGHQKEGLSETRDQFRSISRTFWRLIRTIGHGMEKPVRYFSHTGENGKEYRWMGTSDDVKSPYTSSDGSQGRKGKIVEVVSLE